MRDWADPVLRAEQRLLAAKNLLALGMRAKGATELAEAIDALREALATVQVVRTIAAQTAEIERDLEMMAVRRGD